MVDVAPQEDGTLLITADDETRQWIREQVDQWSEVDLLWELLEDHRANGGFEPFNAGEANPFVGITDAPCIAEAMDHLDDGSNVIVGRFWFFANYMLENPLETLAGTGRVVFQFGGGPDD